MKSKNIEMTKCRLCRKSNKLIKSHIIPEFFFKPAYDRLHRINVLSTVVNEKDSYV